MGTFLDSTDVALIAFLLGMGAILVIHSVRRLRRGDEVTAEEAVKWRRTVRKLGFDASPDMNPAITDILVRAWRTANGWINLGLGVGALLAGIGCGIVFALMGGNHGGDDLSLLITFEASVPLVLYPCVVNCLIVGFSRINREPRDVDHAARPRHVRDYRPLLVALYPPVVLLGNLACMAVLVVRLAPGLDRASLAHAFTLPGMWSVPVVPVVFLAAMIIGDVVTRWITAQPPLYLPQDADIRQRADDHLRRWVVGRLYSLFWLVVFITTQGQFFLLDSGGFGHSPLMIADLDGWFLVYFVAMIMGGLVFALLVPSSARPTTGQTGNGVPGRFHTAE